jgi:hypothetical protein
VLKILHLEILRIGAPSSRGQRRAQSAVTGVRHTAEQRFAFPTQLYGSLAQRRRLPAVPDSQIFEGSRASAPARNLHTPPNRGACISTPLLGDFACCLSSQPVWRGSTREVVCTLRFDADASPREHMQRPSQSAGDCSRHHCTTSSNHIEAPATPQALWPRRERVTQHVLAAAPAPTLRSSARTGRRRHQVVAHDIFCDPEAAGARWPPRRKLSWVCMHATRGARRSGPGAAVAGGRRCVLPGPLP